MPSVYDVKNITRNSGEYDGHELRDDLVLTVETGGEDYLVRLPIAKMREYIPFDPEIIKELRAIRTTLEHQLF